MHILLPQRRPGAVLALEENSAGRQGFEGVPLHGAFSAIEVPGIDPEFRQALFITVHIRVAVSNLLGDLCLSISRL